MVFLLLDISRCTTLFGEWAFSLQLAFVVIKRVHIGELFNLTLFINKQNNSVTKRFVCYIMYNCWVNLPLLLLINRKLNEKMNTYKYTLIQTIFFTVRNYYVC